MKRVWVIVSTVQYVCTFSPVLELYSTIKVQSVSQSVSPGAKTQQQQPKHDTNAAQYAIQYLIKATCVNMSLSFNKHRGFPILYYFRPCL